jgi:DNA-binding transcriptional regulator YdaS (Cro superfamily)
MATITLNTEKLGKITRTGLRNRIKSAGSATKLARELGVSPTTVHAWKYRLNLRANGKY